MMWLFRDLPLKRWLATLVFPIVSLLCFSTVGCANSCFVAVFNPGGTVISGTASNLPLTCPPTIKKASVKVLANVTSLCEGCSASNRTHGFFLSLRGIELHAKASAFGDTSEWVELFPDLEKRPRQVDLISRAPDATASGLLGESAEIPAGVYDQFRLRLAPNPGEPEAQSSTGNACGESGFNCMIMSDGRVIALQANNQAQELRIASEALPGGLLLVSADGNEELHIQLTPAWSIGSFPGSVRFLPLLQGRAWIERRPMARDQERELSRPVGTIPP